jgi:hypothetical protein
MTDTCTFTFRYWRKVSRHVIILKFQQLHLIELIRSNRVEEALAFAQSHLSEAGEEDPSVLQELERTVALLAFEDPLNSPFGDLLAPSHRQKVNWKIETCRRW